MAWLLATETTPTPARARAGATAASCQNSGERSALTHSRRPTGISKLAKPRSAAWKAGFRAAKAASWPSRAARARALPISPTSPAAAILRWTSPRGSRSRMSAHLEAWPRGAGLGQCRAVEPLGLAHHAVGGEPLGPTLPPSRSIGRRLHRVGHHLHQGG